MSFINWGHETPEQKEFRRKLDEQALYEQAMRIMQSRGNAAVGGSIPFSFYGFGINPGNSNFIRVKRDGLVENIGEFNFPGFGTLCRNQDTRKMYVIYQDTEEDQMVVGSIDVTTGEITEIDRTVLTDKTYSAPTSLSWISGNQFLYVDNNIVFAGEGAEATTQKVFILNITDDEVSIEGGEHISEFDSESSLIITSMFLLNGQAWGGVSSTGFPLAGIARFNLETSSIIEAQPVFINNYPNSEMFKVYFFFGIAQTGDGRLYAVAYGEEKDNSQQLYCIVDLDPTNFESTYVHSLDTEGEWFTIDLEK